MSGRQKSVRVVVFTWPQTALLVTFFKTSFFECVTLVFSCFLYFVLQFFSATFGFCLSVYSFDNICSIFFLFVWFDFHSGLWHYFSSFVGFINLFVIFVQLTSSLHQLILVVRLRLVQSTKFETVCFWFFFRGKLPFSNTVHVNAPRATEAVYASLCYWAVCVFLFLPSFMFMFSSLASYYSCVLVTWWLVVWHCICVSMFTNFYECMCVGTCAVVVVMYLSLFSSRLEQVWNAFCVVYIRNMCDVGWFLQPTKILPVA